jgi:hypothetical protein
VLGQVETRLVFDWETTGSPLIGEWGGLEGALRLSDGSIWVSDALLGRVVVIDSAGEYRVLAQKGDGPGEVLTPTRLTTLPDGGVALLDVGRACIDRFRQDGSFRDRLWLPAPIRSPKGFLAMPDGGFLVSGYLNEGQRAVHRLPGGSRAVAWSAVPPPAPMHDLRAQMHVLGGSLAWESETSVLLALASPLRIYRVDTTTGTAELLVDDPSTLEFIGDDFIRPGRTPQERLRYDWSYPRVTGISRSTDGTILIVITRREEGTSEWRQYGPSGVLRGASLIDRPLEILSMTADFEFLALDWPPETRENILVAGRVERQVPR